MPTLVDRVKAFIKDLLGSIALIRTKFRRTRDTQYTEEQLGRLRVAKLLDYDAGRQVVHLEKVLNEQFHNPHFLKMQPNIRNMVKYLADVVPLTFKNGVMVTSDNDGDQEIITQILQQNRFDNLMRTTDRLTFLTKTAFIKVSYRNDQIFLDLISPEYVKVESKDFEPYKIAELAYPVKLDEKDVLNPKGIFAYWTEAEFSYRDHAGEMLINPENTDNINPYGLIPFVAFREREPYNNEFLQWPGDELITGQENINTKLTFRNYLIKRFSIPTPVLTNANLPQGEEIVVDGTVPVQVSSNREDGTGDFEWKSAQADIASVTQAILDEYRTLMALYGVDPSHFIASADKMSGEAIIQSNTKLEERRIAAQTSYQYSLEELWDVIRIVWNVHNSSRKLSDEPIRIQIQDSMVSYTSLQEKWFDIEKKLALNLTTLPEIMLELRNDLDSQDVAEEIIAKNAEINRSLRQSQGFTSFLQRPTSNVSLTGTQ